MRPLVQTILCSGLSLFCVTAAFAYDYGNEVQNAALMQASCEKSLAGAAGTPEMKRESCACFVIGINASGPQRFEIQSLVENDFMAELKRLHNSRPGGWNSAIRACFR